LKIWFDILTPKQVMFFKRAVCLLRESGHQVLCTTRYYREAVELGKIKKLDLTIVGSHGGADRYDKLRLSAARTFDLASVVNQFGPDVALNFSSPEGARVAYGLGIKQFAFNDSPHSEPVARLTVPLVTKLFCPWIIPYSAWAGYGISRKNVVGYRALDPAAWLKHDYSAGKEPDSKRILLRLEESKASYVADKALGTVDLVDRLVESLHRSADITILCRYQDQIAAAEARYGGKVRVLRDVVDGAELVRSAQLFVGAGGTMTAESALLGRPTISITPFGFHVEKYLVKNGLVRKATNARMLVKLAKKMMSDKRYQMLLKKKAARMLSGMEDPTDRMIRAVNSVRL
jgi:predicted glycosyltransferase